MVEGEEKRINAFSLFENTIVPKWEDEINKHGGEFRIDFSASIETVQDVWDALVFQTITGEFAESDKLCGVRLLDKSSNDRPNVFRIEIWTKFAEAQC